MSEHALKFFHGPMGCGKSTLALQIDHNHGRQGRAGMLFTRFDRTGTPRISSRIGLGRSAIEVADDTDLYHVVGTHRGGGGRVDYVIADEVHFYTESHVEQLADLVDTGGVDVYAFGLSVDFRTALFPAARRLFELADELIRLQVEVLCWCGRTGLLNARVAGGKIAREGEQFVVGDVAEGGFDDEPDDVHYQVLCRRHHRAGELGPTTPPAGQLRLV